MPGEIITGLFVRIDTTKGTIKGTFYDTDGIVESASSHTDYADFMDSVFYSFGFISGKS